MKYICKNCKKEDEAESIDEIVERKKLCKICSLKFKSNKFSLQGDVKGYSCKYCGIIRKDKDEICICGKKVAKPIYEE